MQKMSTLDLLKYLALPARLLPKPQRGGVAFSVLVLGIGLDRSESLTGARRFFVKWLKTLPALFAFGQAMTELGTPQLYEREWKAVQGKPPVDEMVAWMRQAVNTGPSHGGFAATVFIPSGYPIWGPRHFKLSETRALLTDVQTFLEGEEFSGEDVWLTVLPKATLSGVPLRPLPPD